MKLSAPLFLILAAFGAVEASVHNGLLHHAARHHDVAARNAAPSLSRRGTARCKVRSTSTLQSSTHKAAPTSKPVKLTTSDKNDDKNDDDKGSDKGDDKGSDKGSTSNNDNSSSGSNNNSGSDKPVGHSNGLIRIQGSSCGSPRATTDITGTHGPNGHIDWFNCGVEDGGWKPPMVTVNDIVTIDLDQALQDGNSPFKACKPYIGLIKKYANQQGIPPIIIASIAMQESSCNPDTVGGGGEQGLMQITKEKCGGAPGGNCREPDFNIRKGTEFFANVLNSNGGSLLKTIGNYNGWPSGMTIQSATAARDSSCCLCQNNLDYLQQMLNGWFLNKSPYAAHMGKYFNLDVCPGRK